MLFEKPTSPKIEKDKNIEEAEMKKMKAFVAIAGALLWGEVKFLGTISPLPLPGGDLNKNDEKNVEEKGWIKTMIGKAKEYYGAIDKVDKAFRKGDWDDLMKENERKINKTSAI